MMRLIKGLAKAIQPPTEQELDANTKRRLREWVDREPQWKRDMGDSTDKGETTYLGRLKR